MVLAAQAPRGRPSARRILGATYEIGRRMYVHKALDAARLMAFDFFLSVVPLLVLVGFTLGRFVKQSGVDALFGPILDLIPQTSSGLFRTELERLAGEGGASIAPLGVVSFLWLTSSGIHQMMDAFEAAVGAESRPWWKQRAIALASVALAIGAAVATTTAILAADDVLHSHEQDAAVVARGANAALQVTPAPLKNGARAAKKAVERAHWRLFIHVHQTWEEVLYAALTIGFGIGALGIFYRFAVEHPDGVRRRAWPGAIAAFGAWFLVSWGFGEYVVSLGSYAVYYGGLAAVAVLLIWLWLSSLTLLFGAELNALLEGVKVPDEAAKPAG